jgi:hypothetical protein
VCGAATVVGTRIRKSTQDTGPTADDAGIDPAEKLRKSALRSRVSLDKKRPSKELFLGHHRYPRVPAGVSTNA